MMIEGNKEAQPKPKLVPVFISRSQAPKGAFKLTEKEILSIQHRRLEKSKTSEKYAFRFGPHVAGGTTAVTACLVNAHFRTKFLLFDYGLMLSYAPVVIVPTVLTILLNEYITNKVLLQPECMGCLEVRSGVIQVASSLLYASIISPISSIALSKKYHTYLIRNNFQPGVRHALKTTPFHRFSFMALMVHNFFVGAGLRYRQGKELDKIVSKEPEGRTRELLETIRD